MKQFGLLWLVGFNAYMLGMTVNSIGDIPKCDAEPYDYWLPVGIFICVNLPAILSYLMGRMDGSAK